MVTTQPLRCPLQTKVNGLRFYFLFRSYQCMALARPSHWTLFNAICYSSVHLLVYVRFGTFNSTTEPTHRRISSFFDQGLIIFDAFLHVIKVYYSFNYRSIGIHRAGLKNLLPLLQITLSASILTTKLLFCGKAKKKIYKHKYYYF